MLSKKLVLLPVSQPGERIRYILPAKRDFYFLQTTIFLFSKSPLEKTVFTM